MLKSILLCISSIFSKLVELFWNSLDRILYLYVLNKNPDESTQANCVLCSLTVSTESDEILFKIDHDLDMIDKHIVNFPKYDHLNWKYFFYVMIPYQLQASWEMMKISWFAVSLFTSNQNLKSCWNQNLRKLILIELQSEV